MTIKELLSKHPNCDILIHDMDGLPYAPLYQIVEDIVKLKCAEQRQLCADKAKINVEAKFKKDIRNTQANSYFYDFKEQGGKREITVYKDSIINASEPTI